MIYFFSLTPANKGKVDLSKPIIISLVLSSKAEFKLFTNSKGDSFPSLLLVIVIKIIELMMCFPYTSCRFPPTKIFSSLPGYCHYLLGDFTKDSPPQSLPQLILSYSIYYLYLCEIPSNSSRNQIPGNSNYPKHSRKLSQSPNISFA